MYVEARHFLSNIIIFIVPSICFAHFKIYVVALSVSHHASVSVYNIF